MSALDGTFLRPPSYSSSTRVAESNCSFSAVVGESATMDQVFRRASLNRQRKAVKFRKVARNAMQARDGLERACSERGAADEPCAGAMASELSTR